MEIKCTNCGSKYQREKEGEVEAELVECPLCSSDEENDDDKGESISKIPISQIQKEPKKLQSTAKLDLRKFPHKYPPELDPFIRERINEMSNPELIEKINKNFPFKMSYTQFASFKKDHGIKRNEKVKIVRRTRKKKYSQELIDFIRLHYVTGEMDSLIEQVNKKFNLDLTKVKFKCILQVNNISVRAYKNKGYPDGLEEFLEENIEMMTNQELADEVKKKFNYSFTAAAIANYMHKRNIKRTGATYKKKTLLEENKKDPSDVFDEDIDELGLDN